MSPSANALAALRELAASSRLSLPLATLMLLSICSSDCNAQKKEPGGYLFAHMTKDDYGRLYYSISRDGINWRILNQGKRINHLYRGHPDICLGRNGVYSMIGFDDDAPKPAEPVLWKSDDLLSWAVAQKLPMEIFQDTPGYQANPRWLGAPKMFYDEDSDQYLICWHAQKEGTGNGRERWISMRTFHVLSSDLEKFSEPSRLLAFDAEADREIATIDVIIRKYEDGYFALIKDERWPEDCETGKTIRLSFSKHLTGPYSNPGPSITPSWFEAPSIVPGGSDAAWYMYAENYPNKYNLFKADSLSGKWQLTDIHMEGVRHGCVIVLDKKQYNDLLSKF